MASYRYNAKAITSSISTTNAAGATGTGLFPFVSSQSPVTYTNNYQVWAGTCRQEQPPAGTDTFTVAPGSNLAQTITEPALQVGFTWAGNKKAPTDVKTVFTGGTGNTCSDTWADQGSWGGAGPSGSYVYGLPFASSATTGSTASGSGQTGSLTTCVDYNNGGTYYDYTSSSYTPSFSTPYALTVALSTTSTKGKC